MPDTSPRLELPYIMPSQAQKHVTHNEAVARLDAVTQLVVLAIGAETPPLAPEAGDIHALGGAPTGGWAGQEDKLALWDGAAWQFITPREGWRAWDAGADQLMVFAGGGWSPVAPDFDNLDGLGVGTAADATNRLAVASAASLFSHAGGDHQMKINKAGTADTASLLFQSGWAGHAEMGLAGDTAFLVKISPDGSQWHQALRLDPDAQEIALAPAGIDRAVLSETGLQIDVPVNGTAVQSDGDDTTPGRLVRVEGAKAAGLSVYGNYHSSSSSADIDAAQAGEAALYSTSTPGTWPANASGAVWVETQRMYVNESKRQMVTQYSGGSLLPPRQWIRVRDRDGTGWTDWAEIYNQASLIGPVSQSGGVPTGAALESGTNANGSYIRLADGTQICQHLVTVPFVAQSVKTETWSFPAAFSAAPILLLTAGADAYRVRFGSVGTTSGGVVGIRDDGSSVTANLQVSAMAIGRWF